MSLQGIISSLLSKIINPLIGVLIGAGILFFLWGVVNYIFLMSGDVKKKSDAKQFMLWGIISITVMFSVWGIIQLLQGIFLGGANFSSPPTIPKMGSNPTDTDFDNLTPPVCDPDADPGEYNACPIE